MVGGRRPADRRAGSASSAGERATGRQDSADRHSARGDRAAGGRRSARMSNWVQKDAAELLGISPRVMNYKIKILNIEIPRSRRRRARRCRRANRQSQDLEVLGAVKHRQRLIPQALPRRTARRPRISSPRTVLIPTPASSACDPHAGARSVDVHEPSDIEMGVPLRGAEPRVSQQLLNGAQVRACLQQVGRRTCAAARAG